jgi:TPP-dependent pyruvate/acetoin dehydrogenase alpha subunit
MDLSEKQLLEIYRWMVMERLFDENVNALFRMGKIMSMFHPALGQEAANVGAYYALQKDDAVVHSGRGKVIPLMRGMDLNYYVAGLFGKKEGFGQGHSPVGSHMTGDASLGMLPVVGSVGSQFNFGVGAALAKKLQHQPNAVLLFCGDGGANRGDVHEGMNFASVFDLPVVFMFVHNGWAISVRTDFALSVEHISERAAGYNIPGVTIDGRDVLKVYETVSGALDRARRGEGPMLVEAMVDRWSAHSGNDPDIYRSDEERAAARRIDPIKNFEAVLEARGLLDERQKQTVRDDIAARLETATNYAESCTEPDYEAMVSGVYQEAVQGIGSRGGMRPPGGE